MITIDQSVCTNPALALHREWLETNGLGGYASSTIIGLNTRRYHGLLVAATQPPVGRMVLLSKLEETLVLDGRRYDLSANRYPGVLHPQGYLYLQEFRQDPFPVFVYNVEGLEIEKSIFMAQGENTTIVRYALRSPRPACTLELRPLIAFRDYHSTTHENPALDPHFEIDANSVKLAPYPGLPPLYLIHSGADIQPAGVWYRNFEYDAERERGLDYREDLFNPLVLVFDFAHTAAATITASTEPSPAPVVAPTPASVLTRAANQFIVRRGNGHSIIAGYHWFGDWGRDTMIALPGLTLATGRYDVAKSILLEWAAHVDRGMLPNRFPDGGESPEYNSVDSALWFFEAVRALVAQTGDYDFVRANLSGVLADIISWHERGTRHGIHVDTDGLLYAGEPGVQLTWMDAKVGDWVVTPRNGKPVEVQALWYNALCAMEDIAPSGARYRDLADRARASFEPLFWNESAQCLYDVVDGDARDASIRPNQIFAVSLFHKMLSPGKNNAKAKAVVDTVAQHLLTPYGLRTLAPGDPHYRGRFEGDPASRDSAYHQGTVWPWLMGPFIAAYRDVYGRDPEVPDALRQYMEQEGVGQLPEVFDGDAPHRPGGCIAQAWSVSESPQRPVPA
jgi:glycogen debranching enzyme